MQKNILALDLGKGSLGLALSRSGFLVTPLREARFPATHYEYAIAAIREILMVEKIELFVIGLPLFPSGDDCEMTPIVRNFVKELNKNFPNIPVEYQDERNSTVEASAMLHANGQKAKKQRSQIDSAAAMVILERYLKAIGQTGEKYDEFE